MKWFKRRCVCEECHVVFEPFGDSSQWDRWCAEHRKPHLEQHHLLEWAKYHLDEVRKLRDEHEKKRLEELRPYLDAQMEAIAKAQNAYGQSWSGQLNAQQCMPPFLGGL